MKRWFDCWLKDEPNGAEGDPAYRTYLMDGIAPAVDYDTRPGRWIAEAEWPAPSIQTRRLSLTEHGLAGQSAHFSRIVETDTFCGLGAGEYFPFGFGPGELPDDQRIDDALSASFDGETSAEPLDLVGAPVVRLTVATDQPRAQIAVRLCDVAPNGVSALITHGFLNLRHRRGFDAPVDMVPGQPQEVSLTLDQCAYRLPAGHRVRLSISPSYWPFIWPEAEAVALTITAGEVDLPVRPQAPGAEWRFADPEGAPALPVRQHSPLSEAKRVETDVATGERKLIIESDTGEVEDLSTGLIMGIKLREIWSIRAGDPTSARADFEWERTMRRAPPEGARGEGWGVRTIARVSQRCENDSFVLESSITAFEGEEQVLSNHFADRIART